MDRKIYEYLDYREYLSDFYQFKKSVSKAFSLRTFSDQIGFKTKDFILRVMNGQKNLSAQSIPMVAQALKLSKRESDFFECLVLFNQAKKNADRDAQFEKLQFFLKNAHFSGKQHLLAWNQYKVYSNWHHLAIRSLIGLQGFSGDYESLAHQIHPRIKPEDARQSVLLLQQCGLIQSDSQGHFTLTNSAITTGDRVSKAALQGFHQHCLRLAAQSIDTTPPDQRNVSGLTLGISKQSYARIVEKLNAFRKEIAQIADEDPQADRVYQLQLLLFPLTHP